MAGIAATVAIAGCQPVVRSDPTTRAPASVSGARVSPKSKIHARATYLERVALPQGATLDVQLIEDGQDIAKTRVLATEHASNLRGPPFDVDVQYDESRVESGARRGLRAWLRDADGTLLFATAARVPVAPGSEAVVELRLVRVDVR